MIEFDEIDKIVNPRISSILKDNGYDGVFENQYESVKIGVQDGNVIINSSTSSGKTLLSEIIFMNEFLKNRKKVVYLVPLRVLATEKYREFKKWQKLGAYTVVSTGDFYASETSMQSANIIITTFEKFDSLIRKQVEWLDDIGTIVVDELHTLGKKGRGEVLEFVLTHMKDKCKIVGLSATIGNLPQIASWLNAKMYINHERKNKLTESILRGNTIYGRNGTKEVLKGKWTTLVAKKLAEGKNILIFVGTRNESEKLAHKIRKFTSIDYEYNDSELPFSIADRFKDLIGSGVLFHNGGLNRNEKRYVETEYLEGRCKVLVATPTLAMGVNLPCDVVIIKDTIRVDSEGNFIELDIQDIKQMIGRAGRKGEGEGIVICNTISVEEAMERYILGKVENVKSNIMGSGKLSSYIMSIVEYGYNTLPLIEYFMNNTLYKHQLSKHAPPIFITNTIKKKLQYLLEHGFMSKNEYNEFIVTPYGKKCIELYIIPETAYKLKSITKYDENDYLELVVTAEEFEMKNAIKKESKSLELEATHYGLKSKNYRVIKNVLILKSWISEVEKNDICRKYKITIGDFNRMIDEFEWLNYSYRELLKIDNKDWKEPEDMKLRIKYGIKSELVEYVKEKGIGKKKARKRFEQDKQESKTRLDGWL